MDSPISTDNNGVLMGTGDSLVTKGAGKQSHCWREPEVHSPSTPCHHPLSGDVNPWRALDDEGGLGLFFSSYAEGMTLPFFLLLS